MTVAFVFSGGASVGASHAGMLDTLYARGIRPDFLVGTSVGAITLRSVCRAIGRRLADDIVRYSEAAELIVLPSPRADGITPMDFGHAQELIAESFGNAHAVLARAHPPRAILRAA